jgi:putative ABC transport system substrate-binding protein
VSRLKTTLILIIFAVCVPVKMVRDADASGHDIGVIYPEVREPYASIFASMLDGIYEAKGDGVHFVAVRKEYNPQDIVDWVVTNKIKRVIALGRRSQKLIENVKLPVDEVVLGAVTRPPDSDIFKAGIVLTPDPKQVYEELGLLLPGIENIYIIYSEASRWYVDIAKTSASGKRFKLKAIESESIADSVQQYKKILNSIDSKSAIWLLQDSLSGDSRLLLPLILEESWDKNFPVISNSAGHVRRGVLLALYPDPFEFGVDLANTLKINGNPSGAFTPFQEALRAANTRTAEHLELRWSRSKIRSFDIVFPSE